MKKLMTAAVVAAYAANALAMPTKAELTKAQPLVAELMAPELAKFKAAVYKEKPAAAVRVGDASSEFAKAAETEAAKFLLLKGAVSFYVRGEQYDKAADTVAALQREVKDVPPAVIAEITGKEAGKISETKAPRLYALYRSAKLQVRAADEAKSLAAKLKKVQSDALRRKYAEALAVSGDWKAAYVEFAKVGDAKLKEIAAAEANGKAKSAESGEFWWAYKPMLDDADDFFRSHAAAYYRKALDAGEITGLKKNLVEQRIAGIAAEAAPLSVREPGADSESGAIVAGADSPFTVKDDTAVLEVGNGVKIEFLRCPAGSFDMLVDFRDEQFQKTRISRTFWISKAVISHLQWNAVDPGHGVATGAPWRPHGEYEWLMRKLNGRYGRYVQKGLVFRFASSAEYEYACAEIRKTVKNTSDVDWDKYDNLLLDRYEDSDLVRDENGLRRYANKLDERDPFFWSEAASALCSAKGQSTKQHSVGTKLSGRVRLVIGPDLVSEWKAKHGKR